MLFASSPTYRASTCGKLRLLSPFNLCQKVCWDPDEAAVIEHVRHNTTIPVPQVLDVAYYHQEDPWSDKNIGTTLFGCKKENYMLMARLRGTSLDPCLGSDLVRLNFATPAQLDRVEATIADWLSQLRSLEPLHGTERVCGFLGGHYRNFRIKSIWHYHVPSSDSLAKSHRKSWCRVFPERLDDPAEAQGLLDWRRDRVYKITLTHGGFLPHNILADDDLNLTGLVDWECAGWMPEYWEIVSFMRRPFLEELAVAEMLKVFPRYPKEERLDELVFMSGYDNY